MFKLVYDPTGEIRDREIWTGSYDVMLNKENVLVNAYDYDVDCFTLIRMED